MTDSGFTIITGTGATDLGNWVDRYEDVDVLTPWGTVWIQHCEWNGLMVWHLNRHCASRPLKEDAYELAPFISTRPGCYWALAEQGVRAALGISAVGKVNPKLTVGSVVIATQFATPKDRVYSFAGHIKKPSRSFYRPWPKPFNPALSQRLFDVCVELGQDAKLGGNLDNIPGPAYETDYDIEDARRRGIDIVGMYTALADSKYLGELGIPLACAFVVTDDPLLPLPEGEVERIMGQLAPAVFKAELEVINRIGRKSDWTIPDAPEPVQGLRPKLELPELVHR